MTAFSPELILSVELIARIMPPGADWWVIGSTALALSGIDVAPRDVDVFAASDVIEAARAVLDVPAVPSGSDRFRSSPYFQFCPEGGVDIDFMGGLQVCSNGKWIGLQIETVSPLRCGNSTIFLPTLDEQVRILNLFGRPKDLARAALIEASRR